MGSPVFNHCTYFSVFLHLILHPSNLQVVAPKKANLAEAQQSLATTMALLTQKRAELKEVEDRLASLQHTFEEKTQEKALLEQQVALCASKLVRAEKLIGGLGGEKTRCTVTHLSQPLIFHNHLSFISFIPLFIIIHYIDYSLKS